MQSMGLAMWSTVGMPQSWMRMTGDTVLNVCIRMTALNRNNCSEAQASACVHVTTPLQEKSVNSNGLVSAQ